MTCQPYNVHGCRLPGDAGSPDGVELPSGNFSAASSAARKMDVARLPWAVVATLLLGGVMPPRIDAQCGCQPLWGPPALSPYAATPYGVPIIIGQPSVQALPIWPDSGAGESITTYYAPAPQPEDASVVLQQIPGAVRVIVPEALLNRLLARNDTDAGPVTDFILGANVTGNQNTSTQLTVDVLPCPQLARLELQLTGTTFNQTIGVTPQAAVRSRGTHQFRVTKQVDFDGLMFTTRSPAAWVTPQLTNEGAATALTGVPVIGPLASQIALTEAERRRPAAEQVITQRVTQQVAPRFNSEVDQQLAEANIQLQQFVPRMLERAGLAPGNLALASTAHNVLFGLSLPEVASAPTPDVHESDRPFLPAPIGAVDETSDGSNDDGFIVIRQLSEETHPSESVTTRRVLLPPPSFTAGASLTVAIHEDTINFGLKHASLGGAEVPDRTIDRLLQHLVELLTGTPLTHLSLNGLGDEEPEFATIVLLEDDPISIRFEQGQLLIEAVAAFEPLLTPAIPEQRVQIPFTLTRADGRLTLQPGEVSVESLPGQTPGPMVELARPIIRQQVTQRLQSLEIPAELPLRLPELLEVSLSVREVILADGWLLIALD